MELTLAFAVLSLVAGNASVVSAQTIVLGAKDAGRVIDGGGREISGGCAVEDWTRGADGTWSAALPPGATPAMLLVNGEPRPMAQYPKGGARLQDRDKGYLFWRSSQNGGMDRPPRKWELRHLQAEPSDIPEGLDVANAIVNRYHTWDESTVKVLSYDPSIGLFTFASDAEHPGGSRFPHDYVIRNIREGMEPGRWMHDRRSGRVIYWPRGGEESGFKAEIPIATSIFKLEKGADGVTIRNFRFRLCNRPDGTPGLRGINPPGIVDAVDAKGLVLENCEFRDSAGQGVRLFRSPGYVVKGCTFDNLGAGGVVAVESYEGRIEGCRFSKVGTACSSACAILAGGDTKLVHVQKGNPKEIGSTVVVGNRIEDVPYCGVVLGGRGHVVASNIVDKSMRVLRDGSAIYLSRAEKCRIFGNVVRDDRPAGGKRHGLYLDEFSWDSVVEGNRTEGFVSGFHSHRIFGGAVVSNRFENAGGPLEFEFHGAYGVKFRDNEIVCAGDVSFRLGIYREEAERNVFKIGGQASFCSMPKVRDGCFVVDGDTLSFREINSRTAKSGTWKKIVVVVDGIEAGRTLAEEIKAVLPPSAKDMTVVAGSLEEHPDADCAVFGFLPRREWLGKSPSFLRDKAREAERDAFCAGFVAKLKGLLASAAKKGMTCVVLTPFPIDEYSPNPDGSEYGDYGNSLWLGSARLAMNDPIGASRAAYADAYMIISRRLAAGEPGLVLPDRITPTRLALRLAARETVGVMFKDADALRVYR
jgi:hypothetical protein